MEEGLMPTRRYVIAETVQDSRELRSRYHNIQTTRLLMFPNRPQFQVGDGLSVQLSIRAQNVRMMLEGLVHRVPTKSTTVFGKRMFAMGLDAKSFERLSPYLANLTPKAPETRANERRMPVRARWSECCVPNSGATRTARILDVTPRGLFLATGLDVVQGSTVLFRPDRGSNWLGGTVCWQGEKAGQRGIGMELVFSRVDERHSWNEFVLHANG